MKHIHERDLLKRWAEIANLLPKFAEVNIGINYIELILCYTLTKISQNDIIGIEKILKSHLNPEVEEEILVRIARSWELKGIEKGREEGRQEGRRKEKIIIAKNLIKAGLKTDLIIASTGLKKEEIEKLQQTA